MNNQSPSQAIFLAAVKKADADERAAFLALACGNDVDLRGRVERMLDAHLNNTDASATSACDHDSAASLDPTLAVRLSEPKERMAVHQEPPVEMESDKLSSEEVLAHLQPSSKPGALGRLGHYDVLEVLGQGGYGTVLRAFDDKLHRVVAIKVMSTAMAATSPARKRFLREARAAAKVRHENVVQIYDVEEQPIPYLAMEYIPGETMEQKLKRMGPIELLDVLKFGQQIARGLAAAHASGLIHRDVKPSNILLEKNIDEQVKITDFGLARAMDDASLTQSGVIAGTPMFMAPEQAQGLTLDHRADLFSLGSVLYTMVSGRPPFRANSTMAVLKRVCEDTPRPIREVIPETPQWLCDIIAKLHAKKPEDRFQSAKEVADLLGYCLAELQQHGAVRSIPDLGVPANRSGEKISRLPETLESPSHKASRQRPSRRKWLLLGAGLCALVALLAIGIAFMPLPAYGTVRIESDDPDVQVMFDNNPARTGLAKEPIQLFAATHFVSVKRGDVTFETKNFTLRKGETMVIKIESLKGKIQVWADGQLIGTRALTPVAVAALPLTGPLPKEFTNRLGMKFALVPKGKALLGGGGGKVGDKEVNFSHDFYLGVYEVTQEEWVKLMDDNPSRFSRNGDGKDDVAEITAADLKRFPVDTVTWFECQEFVKRLNQQFSEPGWLYRLPKAAEWEYACRGGEAQKNDDFSFDYYLDRPLNTLPPDKANFDLSGLKRTAKVGSYPANRLGLHDMHGNVFELCDDVRLDENGGRLALLVGGGWLDNAGICRAANRNVGNASSRYNGSGLRVAIVPADSLAGTRAAP